MRELTASVNQQIDDSERGHALRPSYLVIIGGGVIPQLTLTTGSTFDFLGFTFSTVDMQLSRLSWDQTANQRLTITFSDYSDLIRAYFLNRDATDNITVSVFAKFEGDDDPANVYQVFRGFADGQEFGRGLSVVRAIAQDPRQFTPRRFVGKDAGFNWITKPGTYVINGQTVNVRPRT